MKKNFLVLTLLIGALAYAAVERRSLDLRLPSQQQIEKQTITAAGATSTSAILSSNAGATSASAVTVSSFAGQPDVPRNLYVDAGGTTADVASCVITISGTSINNTSISETFTFAANQGSGVLGNKAFKTVTSVAFPASCEDAPYTATWDVGYGSKLGLKKCMASTGHFLHALSGGTYEATRPTIAASASAVESNTIQISTALSGLDIVAFFMQNYACSP